MVKAHWVVRCATDKQVEEIAESDDFEFPKMHVLVEHIDKACQSEQFFKEVKQGAWKAMNSYTHSGFRQLIRQFNGQRIEASYKDEELVEGLEAATASLMMLGYLLAKSTGRDREAAEIEQLFFE